MTKMGGTHFAILLCGHWIADPHNRVATAHQAPCPQGCGKQQVIAYPHDPIVEMIAPE